MTNTVDEPSPKGGIFRKALLLAILIGVGAGAFTWGRMGAPQPKKTTEPQSANGFRSAGSSYGERPVALIYGNVPISREELAEYLIRRFGKARIDSLINRKILKKACDEQGIWVADAEVDAQVQEDLKLLGQGRSVSESEFENQILRRRNTTIYEWKEDHIRPMIALAKLVKPMIKVEEQELRDAFEAHHGPKVKCRMIILPREDAPRLRVIVDEVRKSEKNFVEHARSQFIDTFAAKEGAITIHKHFGDPAIERTAFSLKKGEVSNAIEMVDTTFAILKCDEIVPADATASFERERDALEKEVVQMKVNQKIPEVFARLRAQAKPQVLITNETAEDELACAAPVRTTPPELPPTLPASPNGELPTPPQGTYTVNNSSLPPVEFPGPTPTTVQAVEPPPASAIPDATSPTFQPTSGSKRPDAAPSITPIGSVLAPGSAPRATPVPNVSRPPATIELPTSGPLPMPPPSDNTWKPTQK